MNWTNHNWSTVQCQIDFCSVGFCSVINCLVGTSSVFNWPLSQLCFCSIVICLIIHLFNLLIALLSIVEWFIVQLARFSVDFLFNCVLFNWLLFSWIFVESFCSIHLVQWVVGEVTWKASYHRRKAYKRGRWHWRGMQFSSVVVGRCPSDSRKTDSFSTLTMRIQVQ